MNDTVDTAISDFADYGILNGFLFTVSHRGEQLYHHASGALSPTT